MEEIRQPKYSIYSVGLIILTLGIALTILSTIGTSPYDALLVGLSLSVGLTIGSWEIIIAFIMIFTNALLKRKRPEFLGLLTAIIIGIGMDCWLFLLNDLIVPEHFYSQLICIILGLIIISLGTAIYLYANFAPMPVDNLMLILQHLTGMNIFMTKTIIYLIFLGLAFLFQGPIGIGTLLTVCLSGPILNYFMQIIPRFMEFFYSKPNDSFNIKA